MEHSLEEDGEAVTQSGWYEKRKMYRSLAVLPLQLACQFLVAENSSPLSSVNISLNSPVPKSITDLPDGYAIFPNLGAGYKNFKSPMMWDQALKICDADGGYLAAIDTFEKVQIVIGLKETNVPPWVGFHRIFDINEWTSVKSGLPAASLPWCNDTVAHDLQRLCTALWIDQPGLYASRCDLIRPFICEIPIFVH